MAVELGIPMDLDRAAQIAIGQDSQLRQLDMGLLGEDHYFILRVGVGFAARKVEYADRALKDRFGILAYTIAGLKALTDSNMASYRLTLDGKEIEMEGLACLVENAGNMGVSGVAPARDISVSDGLLDVILVRSTAIISLLTSGPALFEAGGKEQLIGHWKARHIRLDAAPAQPVHVDGEMTGDTPVEIQVVPGAVSVLVAGGEERAR
jgi:diacylglycerol kinase family enzyme